MDAVTLMRSGAAGGKAAVQAYEDPLDHDRVDDLPIATTRRGLTRLALVAAEAGARFQREGSGVDPMAWMLAPRRIFGGGIAIEAGLERDNCLRAILLHGLGLGVDAEPATIDGLMLDHPDGGDGGGWGGAWDGGRREEQSPRTAPMRRLRLYSALIVLGRGGELVHLFHASVAPSAGVVRERIRSRFGSAAADQADIRAGVDLQDDATVGLLPPAFRAMVERGRGVRWAALPTFDVTVEHRIPC